VEVTTSRCCRCKESKPATPEFFYRAGKSGLCPYCKPCSKIISKERRKDPVSGALTRETQKRYHAANRESRREMFRMRNIRWKREAIAAYGGSCACCGETAIEFLAIDHVNEDGHEHRNDGLRRGHIYLWLRRNKHPQGGRFQVLCNNCNIAKSMYGGCPHRGPAPYRSLQVRIREKVEAAQ
jgi:hypothetical protein